MSVDLFVDGQKQPERELQRLLLFGSMWAMQNNLEDRAERYLNLLLEVGR